MYIAQRGARTHWASRAFTGIAYSVIEQIQLIRFLHHTTRVRNWAGTLRNYDDNAKDDAAHSYT